MMGVRRERESAEGGEGQKEGGEGTEEGTAGTPVPPPFRGY